MTKVNKYFTENENTFGYMPIHVPVKSVEYMYTSMLKSPEHAYTCTHTHSHAQFKL